MKKEMLQMMLAMSVDERVEFTDAFVEVIQLFNPNLKLMLIGEEDE